MTKNEWIFILTTILIGIATLLMSQPLVVITDLPLMLLSLALIFFAQSVQISIGGLVLNLKSFALLYLLLYLTPESLLVLSLLTLLIYLNNIRTFFLRASFEFLQIAVGTLLVRFAMIDHLRILFFSIGYFFVNFILTILYVKVLAQTDLKKYLRAIAIILILSIYSSFILTMFYLFPETRLPQLLFSTLVYAGFIIHLYYTVNAEIWHEELELEKQQITREIRNIMKLPEVLDNISENPIETVLEKVLDISCQIVGFEYALLSIFDFRSGKVIRLSKSGINDEEFVKIKEKKPDIKETFVFMQQRFDIGGAYFIPKGSVDLNKTFTYKPFEYVKLESENAWDPDDLFIVPINYEGRIIGYVSYDKPKNLLRPSKREVEFARFFSWQISKILAESKYSLFFASEYEKKQPYSILMEEISKNIELKKNFVLLYIDIDHFEKVNILFGFHIGDEILKTLGEITAEEVKNLGVFSQVGDEEIILLWSKSKSDGILLAERIIEEMKVRYNMISISASVVKYPADAQTFDELIEKCRTGLVTAKKSGGGRIISL
ncbi:MAG: GGDEF domain-containing protein [Fervidobacterium sp.]